MTSTQLCLSYVFVLTSFFLEYSRNFSPMNKITNAVNGMKAKNVDFTVFRILVFYIMSVQNAQEIVKTTICKDCLSRHFSMTAARCFFFKYLAVTSVKTQIMDVPTSGLHIKKGRSYTVDITPLCKSSCISLNNFILGLMDC